MTKTRKNLWTFDIRILRLFRISDFVLRISNEGGGGWKDEH